VSNDSKATYLCKENELELGECIRINFPIYIRDLHDSDRLIQGKRLISQVGENPSRMLYAYVVSNVRVKKRGN